MASQPNVSYQITSLHQHPLVHLPKERRGFAAAMGRIMSGNPMMCGGCGAPATNHKQVLVCDGCKFAACGKCVKKAIDLKRIVADEKKGEGSEEGEASFGIDSDPE